MTKNEKLGVIGIGRIGDGRKLQKRNPLSVFLGRLTGYTIFKFGRVPSSASNFEIMV